MHQTNRIRAAELNTRKDAPTKGVFLFCGLHDDRRIYVNTLNNASAAAVLNVTEANGSAIRCKPTL